MSLPSGSLLGPYLIAAPIGAGGMGEVYRARDTRLNREVAVKVLSPKLAGDASALARFEREAQALAALSHPNIVSVFDVGRRDDYAYVVMELLEGQTLRTRMAAGPLTRRRTVEYAVQIARALGYAHERGIVHRDLKPENIFITDDGQLKILDLGLAMLASSTVAAGVLGLAGDHSTRPGLIVGTAGYMAPEQARGQIVDGRADIFSFGAVLYEMLAGRKAFTGETAVDTLTAVLHGDSPELPPEAQVPAALDRIVRRCLEKRPEDRFQSARDLAFALENLSTASTSTGVALPKEPRTRWRPPGWALAAGVAAIALLGGLALGQRIGGPEASDAPMGPVRFIVPANRGAVPELSISPDGRYVAWTALADGGQSGGLWLRRLDNPQPELLPDTPSSGTPFWSPDGREVVLADRESRLLAIDVERGERRVLVELGPEDLPVRGGDWIGTSLLIGTANAITLVDTTGRTPRRRITAAEAGRENWHGWPAWLPDGRRFLFTAALADGTMETRLMSVDGGEATRLALPSGITRVRVDPSGYLVFGHAGALVAQRIDLETGALQSGPIRLAPEALQNSRTGWAAVDVSRNGILAWRSPGVDDVQFEWVDRAGRTIEPVAAPDAYTNFDLSPDGVHVIATLRRADAGTSLFLIDTSRNVATLVSDPNVPVAISDPTWSPDGRMIAYRRTGHVVVRNAFGGEERVLTNWAGYPDSWRRDGKYLIVGRPQGTEYELWALAVDGTKEEIPLVTGVPIADEPRFSPNGQWVAFHGAVQNSPEVFAIRFPPTGERWQISTGGGVQPRWRADGRELYYLSPSGQVMAVAMPDGDPTRASAPKPLFNLRIEPSPAFDQFAPAPDGQKFLVRRPLRPGGADTAPVHVIVNWSAMLATAEKR